MYELRFLSAKEGLRILGYFTKHETKDEFSTFRFFDRQLFLGKFDLLKNRFQIKTAGLFKNGKPLLLQQVYLSETRELNALGEPFFLKGLQQDDMSFYFKELFGILKQTFVFPQNGHQYLGFSSAELKRKTAFLTSPYNERVEKYIEFSKGYSEVHRTYCSYRLQLDPELRASLFNSIENKPNNIQVRRVSLFHFRRDLNIFNELVGRSMLEHPDFSHLNNSEHWQLMKSLRFFLNPNLFQFLLIDGVEVGYCFAVPDFKEILIPQTDFKNLASMLLNGKRIKKGRIIYSGILKKHRGKKIFKYLRHQILLEMIQLGYTSVESSYIDEGNINSLKNVESTGAQLENTFKVYTLGCKLNREGQA